MRLTWILLAIFLLLPVAGCAGGGKGTAKAEGEDAAEFARTTKTQVLQFVKVSKENPKTAGGQAEALLERLQVYKSRPVGSNGPVYEDMLQKCKELVDAAKKSPGSGEVTRKLDELAALANKLPD